MRVSATASFARAHHQVLGAFELLHGRGVSQEFIALVRRHALRGARRQPGWLSAVLLKRVTPPGPRRRPAGARRAAAVRFHVLDVPFGVERSSRWERER